MTLKSPAKLLLFGVFAASAPAWSQAANSQPAAPAIRPPFLVRADAKNVDDKIVVHSPDSAPVDGDFTTGLLTSSQPNFTARPSVTAEILPQASKGGDYTVELSIEALMPFGDSSADLFYKNTEIDLLRFSRPGVSVSPSTGTAFSARQPGALLLVLDNHSSFAYDNVRARLRFQDADFCAFQAGTPQEPAKQPSAKQTSGKQTSGQQPSGEGPPDCKDESQWTQFELPQYAQVTLHADELPADWFQEPGTFYARSGKSSGTLTLHFGTGPIHEQIIPIEMQFDPSTWALFLTLVFVFFLLALGAAVSYLLRVTLPNMKRKRALKEQISEINKQIVGLSSEVDSRVRAVLGSECLALDELRTETFPVAPNYADYAKRVEQGLPILSRKVAIAQRLGTALERWRARINAGYEFRILQDSGESLRTVSRRVQKDQITDADFTTIEQTLKQAEDILEDRSPQDQDAFQTKLVSRWQKLREHFGPREANGTLSKGLWNPPETVKALEPFFKTLPKEFCAEDANAFKSYIQDDEGTGSQADVIASALEYVEFAETITPPQSPSDSWKKERENLCQLLLNPTTQRLFEVIDSLWMLTENVFRDDVRCALNAGQARLVVDPENPALNQKFRIAVFFPDPRLENSTARDQLSCRWTFKTTMKGPAKLKPKKGAGTGTGTGAAAVLLDNVVLKHEQGWHAFHYFAGRSVSVEISVDVSDGSETVVLGTDPKGEFPAITQGGAELDGERKVCADNSRDCAVGRGSLGPSRRFGLEHGKWRLRGALVVNRGARLRYRHHQEHHSGQGRRSAGPSRKVIAQISRNRWPRCPVRTPFTLL
jgi:hypothetical protein